MLDTTPTPTLKGLLQEWRYTASRRRQDAADADLLAELVEAEIKRREASET